MEGAWILMTVVGECLKDTAGRDETLPDSFIFMSQARLCRQHYSLLTWFTRVTFSLFSAYHLSQGLRWVFLLCLQSLIHWWSNQFCIGRLKWTNVLFISPHHLNLPLQHHLTESVPCLAQMLSPFSVQLVSMLGILCDSTVASFI